MRNQWDMSGYSMIEIICVLTILALILQASALKIREANQAHSLKRAEQQLLGEIQQSQILAIILRQDLSMSFEKLSSKVQLSAPKDLRFRKQSLTLPTGVHIQEANFGNFGQESNVLRFHKGASITPGRVKLQGKYGRICEIIVSLRGRLRSNCYD